MSTISQEEIALLRENAQKEVELLEKELEEIKERLANMKGQMQAYELLLDGGAVNGVKDQNVELIPGVGGGFRLDSKKPAAHSKVGLKGSDAKPKKKKRAQRATKAEMDRRRKIVAEIFFFNGDLTPKDLNPLVDAALGEHMEPHHLRAVLRRFEDTFEVRPQHGLWGLTVKSREEHSILFGEESAAPELVSAQLSDVLVLPS